MRMETIEQCKKALGRLDGLELASMRTLLGEAGAHDTAIAAYARSEISEGMPASVVTVQTARAMLEHWQAQRACGETLTSGELEWRNAHSAGLHRAQARQDEGMPIAVRIAAEQGQGMAANSARAELALYAVVENAVRAQATEIDVTVERSTEGTVITVTDNGTGVADLRLLGRRGRTGWSEFEHWGIDGQGLSWLEKWGMHVETRSGKGAAQQLIITPARPGEEQVVVSQPLKDGGRIKGRGTRIEWVDTQIQGHTSVALCWRDAARRVAWGWEGRRITVNGEDPEGGAETLQCERNVWAQNRVTGMIGVSKRCTPGQPDVALAGIDAHAGLGSTNTPAGTVYARAQLMTRYRGLRLNAVRDTIVLIEEGQTLKDTAQLALKRWRNEHHMNAPTWRVPGPTAMDMWVRTETLKARDIVFPVLGAGERWALAAARRIGEQGQRYAIADTTAGYETARSTTDVDIIEEFTYRPIPGGGGTGSMEGTDHQVRTIELPMVIDPLHTTKRRVHLRARNTVDVRLIAEAIEECWNETERGAWMETVKAIREAEGIGDESACDIGKMAETLTRGIRAIEGGTLAQAVVTMHDGVVHVDGVPIEETEVGAQEPVSAKIWRRGAQIMRKWFEIEARYESTPHSDEIVTAGSEAEVGAALAIAATASQGSEGKIRTWLPGTSTGEANGARRYSRTRRNRSTAEPHTDQIA